MAYSGKPSRRRFAEIVLKALRRAGHSLSSYYDAANFRLVFGKQEGHPQHFNLANAYREYCAAPITFRSAILQPYVSSVIQARSHLTSAEAMPRLLLRLRSRGFYGDPSLTRPGQVTGSSKPPHRLLADHLAVGLACDLPDCAMEVGDQLLDEWMLTPEQAFDFAAENLKKRSAAPFVSLAPGVFLSPWKDHYDASRLVLPEVVRECEVKGDYVAAVPNQNTLIVTGSEDGAGLETLFDYVEATLSQPRPLSGIPVRLCQGRWVPLELESGHPQSRRLRVIRLQSEADDYQRQFERIYTLSEQNSWSFPGHFVASYMRVTHPQTGEGFSCCTWTEGVPSLLPRTDQICFVRPSSVSEIPAVAACAWARARTIVGDLMTPVGMYPERFRVDQFPTPEQLKVLGIEDWFPRPKAILN